MTVAEFLEARIAEDEAAALPFRNELGDAKQWRCDEIGGAVRYVGAMPFGLPNLLAKFTIHAEGAHVARWDPARVLAECAAKRAILSHYAETCRWAVHRHCGQPAEYSGMAAGLGDSIRHLAAVYSDHPDYDKDWAL